MKIPKRIHRLILATAAALFLLSNCSDKNPVSPIGSLQTEEDMAPSEGLLQDIGSHYVLGGDMLLNKESEEHMALVRELQAARDQEGMAKAGAASLAVVPRWPNGIVYYRLSGFNATEASVIRSVMTSISSACRVKFVLSSGTYYVYKVSKVSTGTSGSTIGYARLSSCRLRGADASGWGVVAHEFLHGLGFVHEHMRPDRDTYVTVNWSNIRSGYGDQFAKLPLYIVSGGKYYLYTRQHTTYDYASIMHYPSLAFSANGRYTLVPKINPTTNLRIMGQRGTFSAGDKAAMVALYGAKL